MPHSAREAPIRAAFPLTLLVLAGCYHSVESKHLATSGIVPTFEVRTDEGESVSASDGVTVSWAPFGLGDAVRVSEAGTCVDTFSVDLEDDPGAWTLDEDFRKGARGSCDAEVLVERLRTGDVSSSYGEGGSIQAIQEDRVLASLTY